MQVATVFFSQAISFVPCFKYADSEDAILFTSRHIHYLVDKAGQFNENYYGMKHELIECITSEQGFVDLNDEHVFKAFKLSELLTESKTVLYAPDYLLQAQTSPTPPPIAPLSASPLPLRPPAPSPPWVCRRSPRSSS